MADFELILLLLLVVDALALITLVLIQQGKGADVGAAFGSGSSNTMFGSAGSTSFLTKMTTWLTVGFFAISFGLAYFAKERAAGLSSVGVPQVQNQPASGNTGDTDAQPSAEDLLNNLPAEVQDAIQEATQDNGLTDQAETVDSDIPDL